LLLTGSASPVQVLEYPALPGSPGAVARDDVQVHLGVLVHQESEVELVRGEPPGERGDQLPQLGMQTRPLRGVKVDHRRAWPFQDDHRLAEQILIAVDSDGPDPTPSDHRFRGEYEAGHGKSVT
jgi:hypothetical protein